MVGIGALQIRKTCLYTQEMVRGKYPQELLRHRVSLITKNRLSDAENETCSDLKLLVSAARTALIVSHNCRGKH